MRQKETYGVKLSGSHRYSPIISELPPGKDYQKQISEMWPTQINQQKAECLEMKSKLWQRVNTKF